MIARALVASVFCATMLHAQGTLVVANQKEHTVLFVDPVKRQALASVVVGVNGHEVAVSQDGRLVYVPIYSNVGVGKEGTNGQFVDVIEIASHKKVASIDLGKPVRPHKPLAAADGMLYISAELSNAIDIIDPGTRRVVGQLPTGAPQSHMFVLSADGRRAYTANVGSGSVSVIDVPARKLITVIPLTQKVQRIALSSDQHYTFTSDQDQPRVAIIDNRTNTLSRWLTTAGIGYTTQATPDGKYLMVSELVGDQAQIEVFDVRTWHAVRTLPIPSRGDEFLLRGALAYLSSPAAGQISVLDMEHWKMLSPIVLTPGVDGMAWAPAAP